MLHGLRPIAVALAWCSCSLATAAVHSPGLKVPLTSIIDSQTLSSLRAMDSESTVEFEHFVGACSLFVNERLTEFFPDHITFGDPHAALLGTTENGHGRIAVFHGETGYLSEDRGYRLELMVVFTSQSNGHVSGVMLPMSMEIFAPRQLPNADEVERELIFGKVAIDSKRIAAMRSHAPTLRWLLVSAGGFVLGAIVVVVLLLRHHRPAA
jgi:hypothetical protein